MPCREKFLFQRERFFIYYKDSKDYGGAVLKNLSKAFDAINHDLLIAKLHVYGLSKESLKLIKSYLSKRWQRTKVNLTNSWSDSRICSWTCTLQHLYK